MKYALKNGVIPLERLVIETDTPFMYPNVKNKKIPAELRALYTENV